MLSILTKRIYLAPLQLKDAASLFEYRSKPEVYRYQSWLPKNLYDAERFIFEFSTNPVTIGQWFQYGIFLNPEHTLIGDCGFCLLESKKAEIGYTISPDYQRLGYGTEAARALLKYIFDQFAVNEIKASTDPRNESSIALLTKLGFQQTDVFPKSVEIRGEWQDDVVFVKYLEE